MPSRPHVVPGEMAQSIAVEINAVVQSYELCCTTHPRFAEYDKDLQLRISDSLGYMRQDINDLSTVSLSMNSEVKKFKLINELAPKYRLANCAEQAIIALDLIHRNHPEVYAEVYELDDKVDHVIVVINRAEDSDPKDPSTWGDDAYICDPWGNETCPASDFTRPKNYHFAKNTRIIDEHGTMTIDTTTVAVTFDPREHTIRPKGNLNTEYIDNINPTEHVEAIVDLYQEKSKLILSALKTFSDDLKKESTRLNKDKSPLGQEKAAILNSKIDRVQAEIKRLEQDIENNLITAADYYDLRDELEKKLETQLLDSYRTTRDITSFTPDELETIQEHKNPNIDKLLRMNSTESARNINDAKYKVDVSLYTSSNLTSNSLTDSGPRFKALKAKLKDQVEESKSSLESSTKTEEPTPDNSSTLDL